MLRFVATSPVRIFIRGEWLQPARKSVITFTLARRFAGLCEIAAADPVQEVNDDASTNQKIIVPKCAMVKTTSDKEQRKLPNGATSQTQGV